LLLPFTLEMQITERRAAMMVNNVFGVGAVPSARISRAAHAAHVAAKHSVAAATDASVGTT
jgi:hypothetical protein